MKRLLATLAGVVVLNLLLGVGVLLWADRALHDAGVGRPDGHQPGASHQHVGPRQPAGPMPPMPGHAEPSHPRRPPGMPPGLMWAALIAVLVGSAVAVALVLPVARSLADLERTAKRLHQGELAARAARASGPMGPLVQQFNQMAERIEAMLAERDALLGAVAHELATPLSRLSLGLELYDDSADAEERNSRKKALEADMAELEQLADELARWVSADREQPPDSCDAAAVVRDVVATAQLHDPGRIALQAPEVVLEVGVAAHLLGRAVSNLIRNALHYGRNQVVVVVEARDREVRIAVCDDGPGIPEAERERVLLPFVRLDASRNRRLGGLGLGLAIVQRISAQAGGRVVIASAAEGGAEVAILLPRAGSSGDLVNK